MERPYVDYKNKVIGKRIDYDKGLGYQCVDLFKHYCFTVLGIHYPKTGNAKEIRTNKYKIFDSKRSKFVGTDDLMQGDIIVSSKGTYGHVGIIDSIGDGKINVLEQNGSGHNSGNGIGQNKIRVQPYGPSFWTGVWRCQKIFDNIVKERLFIDSTIKNTKSYKTTIRYLKQ